jgi:tetratricopeptide (TPR) repeat protein
MINAMKVRVIGGLALSAMVLFLGSCRSNSGEQGRKQDEMETTGLIEQLDFLNKKISSDPLNPESYEERALFYLGKQEYSEAFKDITAAIDLDSANAGYYITLSDVSLAMGRLQRTVEALEKALELDNESTTALVKLAEISIVFLDYQKALNYIDRVLRIDALEPQAFFLRGVVFLENGDTIRAIRNFQQAIDVEQDFFDAHVQLGLLYAERNNALAIDYFNNALNIDPGNIDILYNLAMYYQKAGDYSKAISNYNMILDADPDFFIAYFNLGFLHLVYLEDYPLAIEHFTEAINIRNDYAEAYYNRGFAHELMLNVEQSQSDYRKSLEFRPNYEKAIEGLNRIDEYLDGRN